MKICKSCQEEKSLDEFFSNGYYPSGKKKYKPTCKVCEVAADMERYYRIIEGHYGGMKCQRCGYCKCRAALELHHRVPENKEYQVSNMRNYSEARMVSELEKCDLLCANCHREVHEELRVERQGTIPALQAV